MKTYMIYVLALSSVILGVCLKIAWDYLWKKEKIQKIEEEVSSYLLLGQEVVEKLTYYLNPTTKEIVLLKLKEFEEAKRDSLVKIGTQEGFNSSEVIATLKAVVGSCEQNIHFLQEALALLARNPEEKEEEILVEFLPENAIQEVEITEEEAAENKFEGLHPEELAALQALSNSGMSPLRTINGYGNKVHPLQENIQRIKDPEKIISEFNEKFEGEAGLVPIPSTIPTEWEGNDNQGFIGEGPSPAFDNIEGRLDRIEEDLPLSLVVNSQPLTDAINESIPDVKEENPDEEK